MTNQEKFDKELDDFTRHLEAMRGKQGLFQAVTILKPSPAVFWKYIEQIIG